MLLLCLRVAGDRSVLEAAHLSHTVYTSQLPQGDGHQAVVKSFLQDSAFQESEGGN